ncbi:prolyl oligopeptidase family serine peptidase [Sphingobacteriaceae bacterium WQ 2009]|uniref:Prolyl oligopeptidase family serine peptidase n=1 Tax=Rhinopithecimicrobium faecis TaxID=2820698 RepID=A0A8T4HEM1_9SPHI|nr:prolyl oligopeptidase family serine peptidase [Sphingobacteriaceae bacterium WQ 2009]
MRILLFLAFLCFSTLTANAENHPVKGETAYPFLLNLPNAEILDNKAPIIVFLHGKSLSGSDLNRVQRYGILYAINRGKEIPAIVVAPQTKGGWDADKVMEVVDYVLEKYDADPSRVYICGMSMGGYGTMAVAGKYPERVAAAVAICGGGSTSQVANLAQVPLWLQHGNKDYIVPMSESKKIVKAIKNFDKDADVKLTIIPGGNHGNVERLFHQQAIYDFMFSYSKQQN